VSTIILDACLVITFGNAEVLSIITELSKHDLSIPKTVVSEVQRPPAKLHLRQALDSGAITEVQIDLSLPLEQDALLKYSRSMRFYGKGEAEALALAASRHWVVGSDELAVRRLAEQEFGQARVAGTLDFLIWSVQEERLTLNDAVGLLPRLDIGASLLNRIAQAGQTAEGLLGGKR